MKIGAQVTNKEGEALPGATVTIVDSQDKALGTYLTNASGYFSIDSPVLNRSDVNIRVSNVSYQTQDFTVDELKSGKVELDYSGGLEEISVIGYVKKKMKSSPYAVPVALAAAGAITLTVYFILK